MDDKPAVNPATHAVAMQLEAYNARDIDAFMQWWADDCQYFEFPARLLAEGSAAVRARHVERFREPDLFARLIHRVTVANVVIDHEMVTRTFPEGPGVVEVLAIYEIVDGKIATARFKSGPVRTTRFAID